jgi:molecular chaperone HtpG
MLSGKRQESAMTVAEKTESRPFEADVAKLLQLMVHSVYSDKSVFLRELIANAADACERLRYEAIAEPSLLGDDVKPRIAVALDPDRKTLTVGKPKPVRQRTRARATTMR